MVWRTLFIILNAAVTKYSRKKTRTLHIDYRRLKHMVIEVRAFTDDEGTTTKTNCRIIKINGMQNFRRERSRKTKLIVLGIKIELEGIELEHVDSFTYLEECKLITKEMAQRK